ncbi:MAG: hypothetical protein GWO41_12965 [candidate division Zixibacteria bacterium]|nr:hypothetical protein [candidate division Zixibacteria bacterium]NIR66175.1 hypothetical protein [candidate division Zixibacteria bacterium]NIS17255.1 hypothetical protein [candidate division Zixibacteria bacterium]NIS47798.1 hypothetical protein [candidate division Zixibacteria bacterium]NIT53612.1 hypothetical protein [candidate division Zixibacteria bacterium]
MAKIKEQFKETIEWSKNVQKRLTGIKSPGNKDLDVHHILESLFKQVDRDKDEYIKQVDVCKQKYISDSETIKMALTKLLTSLEHEQEISQEKASRLQELLHERFMDDDDQRDEIGELKAKEKSLAALEKEVIEILSRRFTK